MFSFRHARLVVQIVIAALVPVLGLAGPNIAAAAGGPTTGPTCGPFADFNPRNFSYPTRINNPWETLVAGTQFTMNGSTSAGTHQIVFTVTDLTKMIYGVTTRVMWDVDIQDGVLAEFELAFQAQDNSGNIWVLGEYPEEYDAGTFTGAPSTWISGLQGAKPGVLVPGHPKFGTPAFVEGYSPKISFWDCGQVTATGKVLVVNEWAPLDPTGGTQQKYYTSGTGLTQIGDVNDPQAEVMTLTKVVHLNAKALAKARAQALTLDQHGYQVSSVYAHTPRAQVGQ